MSWFISLLFGDPQISSYADDIILFSEEEIPLAYQYFSCSFSRHLPLPNSKNPPTPSLVNQYLNDTFTLLWVPILN